MSNAPELQPGHASADPRSAESAIRRCMEADGASPLHIESFLRSYRIWSRREPLWIAEDQLEPARDVPDVEALPDRRAEGRAALAACAVIKLNGGLGTSMGLNRTKALIPVRGSRTFLDFILEQTLAARRRLGVPLPLLFMHSFQTHTETEAVLADCPALDVPGLPHFFLQSRVPRLDPETGNPVQSPDQPAAAWCPPGHGEFYVALNSSGVLDRLLERGFRYAFVANADNLGATLDLQVLGQFAATGAPLMMEVTDRTTADSKGGHLARRAADGTWMLRETAQCPPGGEAQFRDIRRHAYFNTNNLWLDLVQLRRILDRQGGLLTLPVMAAERRLRPCDPSSPRVIQIETAMGAAISALTGAAVLRVPRTRFAPVKTTDDLLRVQSDVYVEEDGALRPNPERRDGPPEVRLDPRWFGTLARYHERFPGGAPSLLHCTALEVTGDIRFGRGVRLCGRVKLVNAGPAQRVVADGTRLGDEG